jgi:hypothetical protein
MVRIITFLIVGITGLMMFWRPARAGNYWFYDEGGSWVYGDGQTVVPTPTLSWMNRYTTPTLTPTPRDTRELDYCYDSRFNQETITGSKEVRLLNSVECKGGKTGQVKRVCWSNEVAVRKNDGMGLKTLECVEGERVNQCEEGDWSKKYCYIKIEDYWVRLRNWCYQWQQKWEEEERANWENCGCR